MKKQRSMLFGLALGLLTACGPMNKAPENSSNGSSGPVNPGEMTELTQQSLFLFHAVSASTTKSVKTPGLGENIYTVEVFCRNPMRLLSAAAKVTFIYWMPEMPDMGKIEEPGKRQTDGSFQAAIVYSMRGHWEMTIKIEDDAKQDRYVFNLDI